MPTLLYEHVLQHGEKTVLQLRKQLASFLQFGLSPASVSAVRPPDDEQRKPQQPEESTLRRNRNPEHQFGEAEEDKNEEELVLVQTEDGNVSHVEEEEDGRCDSGPIHAWEHLPRGQTEEQHLSAAQKEGTEEHVLSETRGRSHPPAKSEEELKGNTDVDVKVKENGSKLLGSFSFDKDKENRRLPESCAALPSAEQQLLQHTAAGKDAVEAQAPVRGAAGNENRLPPFFNGEQKKNPSRPAGAEVVEQKNGQPRTVDRSVLATFLASSSAALSQLLKEVFLLECLPPEPFVNIQETSISTHSSTRADAVEQGCRRSKKVLGGENASLGKSPRLLLHEKAGVLLQFLPKSFVISHLLKDVGNALLAQQQLDAARCTYTASLQLAPFCAAEEQLSCSFQRAADHKSEQAPASIRDGLCATPNAYLQHVAVLLGNRSAVHLKQQAPVAALRDATAALQVDPTYSKAWFRRSSALLLLADLLQAESVNQRTARIPPQALQRQNQLAAAQRATESMPCFSSPHVPAPFDAARTAAADAQNAARALCSGGGHALSTGADGDACCSIVERLLREEAAYCLARSVPEKFPRGSVSSVSSLPKCSSVSSGAACTTASASSSESPACSAADGLTSFTTSASSSSFSHSYSSRCSLSSTSMSRSWSEAHDARDGEGDVFHLGACACEATVKERLHLTAAARHIKTNEARKCRASNEENEDFLTAAAGATKRTLQREQNDSLSPEAAAVARSAVAPGLLSLGSLKAQSGEFADRQENNSKAPLEDSEESRVETKEAAETSVCSGATRTGDKRTHDKETHMVPCCNVGARKESSETGGTRGGEEAIGPAKDQKKAHNYSRTHETKSAASREKSAGASAGESVNNFNAQSTTATVAAAPHSVAPRSNHSASAAAEGEVAEPLTTLLDSFVMYLHPDVETRTAGPLGTSVHWREKALSGDQGEVPFESRTKNQPRDEGLVLEEYPIAAYCAPTQNTMQGAALPIVKGRTQFLQQWTNYMQEGLIPRARTVCAGCSKPVGTRHQQLEGVELVHALYRRCRLICRPAGPAAQGRRGGRNAAREKGKHHSVGPPKDSTRVRMNCAGQRIGECHTVKVDDTEQQMERKCRRLLCDFLTSVELVAPCTTCNAALFCCQRCRNASHHVVTCRGKIGVHRAPCKEGGGLVMRSTCSWTPMWKHSNADTEECVSHHLSPYGESQASMQASTSTRDGFYRQTSSYAEDHVPPRGSMRLRSDAAGDLTACKKVMEKGNMSMWSVLTAASGILRAAYALASLVATAYNAEAHSHGFASTTVGKAVLPLPEALASTSDPAQAKAAVAAWTLFERKRAENFTAAHQLRVSISQYIAHDVTRAARVCTSAREDHDSRSGCRQDGDSDARSHCKRPQDLSSVYSVQQNCRGLQGDGYDISSIQLSSASDKSYTSTNLEIRGSALHCCELPVAYTAGGALDDGARQLARQIFPLFLSRTSFVGGLYHSTNHPVTHLAAHLPADAGRLCDAVVNAVWLAGEYFFEAASNSSRIDHDSWKQPALQDSSSGAVVQKRCPACVPRRADVTLNSEAREVATVCEVTDGEIKRWEDERNVHSADKLTEKENRIYLGSDICEAEQEDDHWSWLRSSEVLEAALAAYGVACTNSFATRLQQDETGGWVVGRALYLFASQFNHSCTPNTVAIFDADVPRRTTNDAIKASSCGWRNTRKGGDERKQGRDYLENQHRVYENPACGPRSGCALKLRYYGCDETRHEDRTAANERGRDKKGQLAQEEKPVGEELTVSYTAVAGGRRDTWWSKRRQVLCEEALFSCRCLACEAWKSFLATIRKAGPQGLPPLFRLQPDHLQSLPCRRCYCRESKITERNTSPRPHRNTTQVGIRHDISERDALWPVVALLSTSARSRRDTPVAAENPEDDSASDWRRFQRSFVARNGLEDVVALRAGFLLLESICNGLVAADQWHRVCDRRETATPSTQSCRHAGVVPSCSPRATLHHRVTSTASLAVLGHSMLPVDDMSCMVQADLHGDSLVVLQPRDSQSSEIQHCDTSLETLDTDESAGITTSNVRIGCSGRRCSNVDGGSSGGNSGTSGLREGMVKRSGLQPSMRPSAQNQINQVMGKISCSGSYGEVAGKTQSTRPMCTAGTGQVWICMHCGFTENEFDFGTSLYENPDTDAVRRSIETTVRLCNEVRDVLKRGEQLLHIDKSKEVQLHEFLVHMAQTRGQLSHEVCTALDIWAMWATECAAVASSAESELCTEWSRGHPLQPGEGNVETRGKALAELGAKLAEIQQRNNSLAFRLHLGATWVHSIRFPRGWQQPELCTELYKCAALAGNAGCVQEGMLLAKAAEYSGTTTYGPGHPIVEKIRELVTSFRERHSI